MEVCQFEVIPKKKFAFLCLSKLLDFSMHLMEGIQLNRFQTAFVWNLCLKHE
ncbi:hypothetical protein Hanom_Chr12g01175801 [Helianthus anomalus]